MKSPCFPTATVIVAAFLSTTSGFAQGSLTPPGPPGPTMKTLDQLDSKLEKRTPIAFLPYLINAPGSYYVTTNLTGIGGIADGITIGANDVTLDLNGFTLDGGGAGGTGVHDGFGGHTNICIRNGTVRAWGIWGVDANAARNSRFDHLRISNNVGIGLYAGANCMVNDCLAEANGSDGFFGAMGATFTACASTFNVGSGFNTFQSCGFTRCLAGQNAQFGFYPADDCVFAACTALANQNSGINAGSYAGCRIQDCIVTGNTNVGIACGKGSLVSGCSARLNAGDGISTGPGSTVGGCNAAANTSAGIRAGDGNEVSRCTARENGNEGIITGEGSGVSDCTVQSNAFGGITVADGSTVRNCATSRNKLSGILSGSRCQILENNCSLNGAIASTASGVYLNGNYNRAEGNNVVSNQYAGIFSSVLAGPSSIIHTNLIIRNSAHGNAVDFQILSTDTVGPIVAGSGIITTNNPWANFSF